MKTLQITLNDVLGKAPGQMLALAAQFARPTAWRDISYYACGLQNYVYLDKTELPDGFVLLVVKSFATEKLMAAPTAPLVEGLEELFPGKRSREFHYFAIGRDDAVIILARAGENETVSAEDLLAIDYRERGDITLSKQLFTRLFGDHFPADCQIMCKGDVLLAARLPLAILLAVRYNRQPDDTTRHFIEILRCNDADGFINRRKQLNNE